MAVQKYGLDLGTENIKLSHFPQGMILCEKNLVAAKKKQEIVAFGDAAYDIYERASDNIRITYPISQGVIAGLTDMKQILDLFLKKAKCSNGFISGNAFYFSVPSDVTEVEKRAFFDVALSSQFKSKDAFIVEKPMAAVVGEGVDLLHSPGVMVIDMGAGTTEVSILAQGGIVLSRLLKMGGNTIDDQIQLEVKTRYNLLIGRKTAESLKLSLGSAILGGRSTQKVLGRDIVTGLPAEASVDSRVICACVRRILKEITASVRSLLERIPPEVIHSILSTGIHVTGGVSQTENLETYLKQELALPIQMSEHPLESTVRGLTKIMSEPSLSGLAYSIKESIFS